MDFAGLVPGDTPFENQTKNPPPGRRPVQDHRRSDGPRLRRSRRTTNYPEIEGLPAAKLDKITINAVTQRLARDHRRAAEQGRLLRRAAQQRRPARVPRAGSGALPRRGHELDLLLLPQPPGEAVRQPAGPPGGQLRDRQARAARVCSAACSTPGCNFLPPGMQGYEKIDPCPYGDPKAAPDIEKAKQLIQEAGVAGESVTVYGNDEELTRNVTEYLADVLEQIGLKPQLRIVNGDVYFQTIGNQKTKAAAGFANWFQDYPHPYNFMFLDRRSVDPEDEQPELRQRRRRGDQHRCSTRRTRRTSSEAAPEYAARRQAARRATRTSSRTGTAILPFIMSDRIDFESGPVPPGAAGRTTRRSP